MKVTKIEIENLFGLAQMELDGKSIELNGIKGSGKTSVLDAIILALTNNSNREKIIHKDEKEGRITIKTDSGLNIERKKRVEKADYKSIKENGTEISSPESFLKTLFTPLQLDPVAFTLMDAKEQNRMILDLIDFNWDMSWIQEQFGEIPEGVEYSQNILRVLHDIQKNDGQYFLKREEHNREKRFKLDSISEIAADIPAGYQLSKWQEYDIGTKYRELEKITIENNEIERSKVFKEDFENKLKGLEAEYLISLNTQQKLIQNEKSTIETNIARMEAELIGAKENLSTLAIKLNDKTKILKAENELKIAKLKENCGVADEYAAKEITDTTEINAEISEAEKMMKHVNEYIRMQNMQKVVEQHILESEELTRKIELARTLPGKILQNAEIPVENLTVVEGVPLIKNRPISNLSTGEKLELCVDIATAKPLSLQLILLDRLGDLDDSSRNILYQKCKEKGVQFIATRTTNASVLEVVTL